MDKVSLVLLSLTLVVTALAVGNLTERTAVANKDIVTSLSPLVPAVGPSPTPKTETGIIVTKEKKIQRLMLDETNTVLLFSEIDTLSVNNAIKQLNTLAKKGKPLYLVLYSPGGSVLDGAQLINTIEGLKVPVNTVCFKMCASMAAYIHQYGKNRYMVDRSLLMFHQAAGGFMGYIHQVKSRLAMLERYLDRMERYVTSRSGMNFQKFADSLSPELWLESEDAVEKNFSDGLVFIDLTNLNISDPAASDKFKQLLDVKML
jgi:ATP-dependent Clp protease protease subunit